MKTKEEYLNDAIQLATENVKNDGGPFGAVIIDQEGNVVGQSGNRVTASCDPTAHAEVMAIRDACQKRQNFMLDDCVLYSSCEPCPMCLGAIYWARIRKVYYAATRHEAADAGFSDEFIYQELEKPIPDRKLPQEHLSSPSADSPFTLWKKLEAKVEY
eukprot:gb/GECG01012509.1/.p1 GENE.gb/GECG01012509.1/~~gb/GECG01012509.1/.p1  ORF type:complete len:158 (+),score=24.03 gb/GECG01012509.1/:1-474(+)